MSSAKPWCCQGLRSNRTECTAYKQCDAVEKTASAILVHASRGVSSRRREVASFLHTALANPSWKNSNENCISSGNQVLWWERREAQSRFTKATKEKRDHGLGVSARGRDVGPGGAASLGRGGTDDMPGAGWDATQVQTRNLVCAVQWN